jgi:ATP-binding cassette subfamily A (ABC1) protein 3
MTSQFLDEADLLADHIAILAAPGKVLAEGSPVALKRDLGDGYSVQVSFAVPTDINKLSISLSHELLDTLRMLAPQTYLTSPSPSQGCYHLRTKDSNVIGEVLDQLEYEMVSGNIRSYDILGTTIEDIFLDLMAEHNGEKFSSQDSSTPTLTNSLSSFSIAKNPVMDLPNGRIVNPFRQAFTIFHKRVLIARRSWLTPLLTILIAIAGACIPLIFIKGRNQSCVPDAKTITAVPLFLPISPLARNSTIDGPFPRILASPPGILSSLGNILKLTNIVDNATFMSTVPLERHNLALGGISVDIATGNSVVAWEASPPGVRGSAMLNLLSNVLYNRALNLSGTASPDASTIATNYAPFSRVASATLVYLKWLCFFGGVMVNCILLRLFVDNLIITQAVYPAFYALYVSQERRTSVQAMQLSNGLTNPVGLWLGHLIFDTITTVILSTGIIIIFAVFSDQFHGLGALVCFISIFV